MTLHPRGFKIILEISPCACFLSIALREIRVEVKGARVISSISVTSSGFAEDGGKQRKSM